MADKQKMATILPPIEQHNGGILKHNKKEEPQQPKMIVPKKFGDRMAFERSYDIINKLPVLKSHNIAKFRNSYKHNLCLELLTRGFHMSFCELTILIRQQTARRNAAGPDSFLWTKPVLEKETVKLDMLKRCLMKAETAKKLGDIVGEYKARYDLANSYIDNPDDQWLADHFFNTCLEVARREDKETKMLAEGLCNVGLCLQKNLNFKEAAKHFEAYHRLTKNTKETWIGNNGNTFLSDSCVKLYHIYTILGLELGRSGEEEDTEASLQYLIQAVDMAKDSQDKKLEGEASYNLGLAYQKMNDLDAAQSHMFNFYESCHGDSNSDGIGRACDAIAKIYARKGNKEKSVEFLKRFVELTEKTGLEREYCLACYNLGNVCNSVGNYDEATEYFSKAYNISRSLQDLESASINRVQYGIAVAHRMMGKFANHIIITNRTCITRLLQWKSVRIEEFNIPIPDTAPGADVHVLVSIVPSEKEATEASQEEEKEEEEELVEEKEVKKIPSEELSAKDA